MCSNTTVFVIPNTITQNNIIQPLQQTRTISIKSTLSETTQKDNDAAVLRQASFAVASISHNMQLWWRVERRFATGTNTQSSLYYFCSSFVKFVCQFCLEEFRRHTTTFFSQRQRLNAKAGHWHATMASAAVVVALHPRCRIPFKNLNSTAF